MARKRSDTSGGPLRGGFSGYSSGGGVSKFTNLSDVPHSYSGMGGDVVIVKPDESGLTFSSEGLIDDHKVIVAGDDTTPGYLLDKIISGSLWISEQDTGSQKVLLIQLNVNDTFFAFYTDDLGRPYLNLVAGSITHSYIAAANKDGLAATPSMRTLGAGAQQAAPGNIIASVSNATDEAAAFAAGSLIVIRTDLI